MAVAIRRQMAGIGDRRRICRSSTLHMRLRHWAAKAQVSILLECFQASPNARGTIRSRYSRDGLAPPRPAHLNRLPLRVVQYRRCPRKIIASMELPRAIERNRSFAQPIHDKRQHNRTCRSLPIHQSSEAGKQRKRSQRTSQKTPGNHAASISWPTQIAASEISRRDSKRGPRRHIDR